MQILLSSSTVGVVIVSHLVLCHEGSRSLFVLRRHATSRSLLDDLRLISRIRRVSAHSTVARQITLIVVIVLLVLGEGVRGSVLMRSSSYSDGCTCVVHIVTRVACVDTSREIHAVSASSSNWGEATACSVVMLACILVILGGRG